MREVGVEDEFLVSYEAVTPGVPVLTRDGEQFGILEHVLEVPQLDLFDGIVVWVGGGGLTDREIQKELAKGHQSAARGLERGSLSGGLRFIDARSEEHTSELQSLRHLVC